jgi:hypothetical protein
MEQNITKKEQPEQPELSLASPLLFNAVLAISLPTGITRADRRRVAELADHFLRP